MRRLGKISFFFWVSFSLFVSCEGGKKELQLLTDDLFLLDAASLFNAEYSNMSVNVTVLDKEKNGIFSALGQKDTMKYDLIAGEYFPLEPLHSSRYSKVDLNENSSLYSFVKDFHQKTRETGVIYSYDFPVIVSDGKNLSLSEEVGLDDFQKIAVGESSVEGENESDDDFAFVPAFSHLPPLEFYLLRSDLFLREENKVIFNKTGLEKGYRFYHFFNQEIADESRVSKFIRKNLKMDKYFSGDFPIQKYDFRYFSEAIVLSGGEKKIELHYLMDNSNLSLKQNVICINKKSFLKKEAAFFIDFLLRSVTQEYLFEQSQFQEAVLAYRRLYLPVVKGLLSLSRLEFPYKEKIERYVSNLKYPYLGDEKRQRDFMNIYNITVDMVAKERLKKEDFVDFLEKQIE